MLNRIIDLEKHSSSVVPVTNKDYIGDGSKILTDQHGNVLKDAQGVSLTDKGLIYCGNCNTRKQTRIYSSAHGRVIEPYCLCRCLADNEKRIDKEFRERERQLEIERNLRNADKLMLQNTFSKDKYSNSDISRFCKDYCRNWANSNKPKNIGLYLYGDVGTGKSFYASCIANEVAKVFGDTIKVVSTVRLIKDLYSLQDKGKYIDELACVDLLVLDDLGAEQKNEFSAEQLFSVVDERYKAQKPLIITSNLNYESLKNTKDISYRRIFDRIIDMCLPVHCVGESKRGLVK